MGFAVRRGVFCVGRDVFYRGSCGSFWMILDTVSAVRHPIHIVFPPSISKIAKIMSDGARNQSK